MFSLQVVNSEAFVGIRRETLQVVLEQESLSVEEDDLLTAVLRWAGTRGDAPGTRWAGPREDEGQETSWERSSETGTRWEGLRGPLVEDQRIRNENEDDDVIDNDSDLQRCALQKRDSIEERRFNNDLNQRFAMSDGVSDCENNSEEQDIDSVEKNDGCRELATDSVLSGLVERIRVHSVSDRKLRDLLQSRDALAVELSLRLRMRRKTEERVLQPRLEFPTGHVTCDVISTFSSCLVYSGRACPALHVKTSEPITLHKILILDRRHNNTSRVSVKVIQNDKTLLFLDTVGAYCREAHALLGPVFAVLLPGHGVRVEQGEFQIEARYSAPFRSYSTVHVGVPAAPRRKFGVLDFRFPNVTTATPVASFDVVVE